MNIKEMAKQYLTDKGYDGLFNYDGECACELSDLEPCSDMQLDCEAGYKVPCPGGEACDFGGDCGFHIQRERP